MTDPIFITQNSLAKPVTKKSVFRMNCAVLYFKANLMPLQKSIDKYQPAQSAQADMGRCFLHVLRTKSVKKKQMNECMAEI